MADRENEKKYSAETKGYTDKIYEVRFMPVLERSEYQAGPEREGLIKLQGIMAVSYTHLTLPTIA